MTKPTNLQNKQVKPRSKTKDPITGTWTKKPAKRKRESTADVLERITKEREPLLKRLAKE